MAETNQSLILDMLRGGQNDLRWYEDNIDTLKLKYDNQFIAFSNQTILGADSNLDNLMMKLKKENIDTSNIFIKFLSKIKFLL